MRWTKRTLNSGTHASRNVLAVASTVATEPAGPMIGIVENLLLRTNQNIPVPIYRIERDGESVDLVAPVMLESIFEDGYWTVVGRGLGIFADGDSLEDALYSFCDGFLEMKHEFYDVIVPGYEGVALQYRRFIEGFRWRSTPNV